MISSFHSFPSTLPLISHSSYLSNLCPSTHLYRICYHYSLFLHTNYLLSHIPPYSHFSYSLFKFKFLPTLLSFFYIHCHYPIHSCFKLTSPTSTTLTISTISTPIILASLFFTSFAPVISSLKYFLIFLAVTGLFLSNESTIEPVVDLVALGLREASRDR